MAHTVSRVAFGQLNHPLQLDLRGTAFQLRVWQEVLKIPFGRQEPTVDLRQA